MNLIVIWSDSADERLDGIYEYYEKKAGTEIAFQIVTRILEDTQSLEHAPFSGQVEELLRHRPLEYRYRVIGNYKVIYHVDEKRGHIAILDVFDCRQSPQKLGDI